MANGRTYRCSRCGTTFPTTDPHTELVRRDFLEVPQPSRIDRLCRDCWATFVDDFLGDEFEETLERYDAAQ